MAEYAGMLGIVSLQHSCGVRRKSHRYSRLGCGRVSCNAPLIDGHTRTEAQNRSLDLVVVFITDSGNLIFCFVSFAQSRFREPVSAPTS